MRSRVRGRGALGVVLGLLAGGLAIVAAPTSVQAAVSSVTVGVKDDGSGPYDGSTTNDIVETHDQVQYSIGYAGGSGTETFTVTLPGAPSGVYFDPVSASVCNGGTITNSGHTLTCPLTLGSASGAFYPVVNVDGTVPNGTLITPTVSTSSGPGGALATPTEVVAVTQLTIAKNVRATVATNAYQNGPGVAIYYPITISNPAEIKGSAMPTSPITFTEDLSAISPNAQLITNGACSYVGAGYGPLYPGIPFSRASGYPSGQQINASNSVVDSGTINCVQSGSSVAVTITGGDYSGNNANFWNATQVPQKDSLQNPLPAGHPNYLGTFMIGVFVPNTDIDAVAGLDTINQIRGFNPTSANADGSTQANTGQPGADNGPTCPYDATNATLYCNSQHITQAPVVPSTATNVSYAPALVTNAPLPNQPNPGDFKAPVTTGQTYWARIGQFNFGLGAETTNVWTPCIKWNPAQEQIAGSAQALWASQQPMTATDVTIEYGVLTTTATAASPGGGCGDADGTWSSSIAGAGGPTVVNAVRFVEHYLYTSSQDPNGRQGGNFGAPMQVVATNPGTTIGMWGELTNSTGTVTRHANFNDVTATGGFGDRTTLVNAIDRVVKTTADNDPTVAAGATKTFTLAPTVTATNAVTEHGVTIADTLPRCTQYVAGSASGGPPGMSVTVTPGNDGADGVPCSGDAGETGAVVFFHLGDLTTNTAVPVISYQVTATAIAPNNTQATNTAVIDSTDNLLANTNAPGNSALAADLVARTVSYPLAIGNTAAFSEQKSTADTLIEVNDGFTDTIAFVNSSGAPAAATLIDVFPYSGDAAGSTFSGTVALASVTPAPLAGETLTVTCTTDAPATIDATNPAVNNWTAPCDAAATGLKVVATAIPNGGVSSVQLGFTTSGTHNGDVIANRIAGTTTNIAGIASIGPSAPAVTNVVGGVITGTAYSDANDNGTRDSGEAGLPGITVSWTGAGSGTTSGSTVTGAGGVYTIPNLHAGSYTLTFTNPTTGDEWTTQGAGSVPNPATGISAPIALAAGTDPANPVTVTANAGVVHPSVKLTKGADVTSVNAAGDAVNYTFLVENTGTATLSLSGTGLGVTDVFTAPAGPALTGISCPQMTLVPGASTTCTAATYHASQDDIDNGSIVNTAMVVAASNNGTRVQATSSLTINAPSSPLVVTVKAADAAAVDTAGHAIGYTVTVTNTGNVTLHGVTITDAFTAPGNPSQTTLPLACSPKAPNTSLTTLAPGAEVDCTASYTTTQDDIDDGGDLVNVATAAGLPPKGQPVQSSSTATVEVTQTPALTVAKTASPTTIAVAGTPVAYSFVVTNTGNVTLDDVVVVDSFTAPAGPEIIPVCPTTTLAPGATATCAATYQSSQADIDAGSIVNTATASATSPAGSTVTSPPSAATVSVEAQPAISLTTVPNPTIVTAAGQQVAYTFTVTNNGNQTLTGVTIAAQFVAPAGPAITPNCPSGTLAPAAVMTCTATYAVSAADIGHGRIDLNATASGTTVGAITATSTASGIEAISVVSAQTTATVFVQTWTATKTADPAPGAVLATGQRVTYTLTVVNTGGVAVTAHVVDNLASVLDDATFGNDVTVTGSTTATSFDGQILSWTGSIPVQGQVAITYSVIVKPYDQQGDHQVLNVMTSPDATGGSGCTTACSTSHPTSPPTLPFTGLDIMLMVGLSVALVGGGSALLIVRRRRRAAI